VAGQLGAFGEGLDHARNEDRSNLGSIGLAATSDSWTSQVQAEAARPHSLLQPLYANQLGVGMDERTAAERFPDGQLPANPGGNGQTEESIMPTALLRMGSRDTEAA
jgi:hypothetical protein